ncbi:MAG: hypothetical protein AB7S26_21910 [Sandaracinaceae bacterium]
MDEPAPEPRVRVAARLLGPRVRGWLAHPRLLPVVLVLSALAASSSLGLGLQLDDHAQRLLVERDPEILRMWPNPPARWDLFRFADGSENTTQLIEQGVFPWYMTSGLRLAFLRPLASVTHNVDYLLLERAPALMHLHSVLWFAFLVWAVWRLIRRVESGWMAGLLLVFYAFDATHGTPIAWLANRNALIAGAFGALALERHIAARMAAKHSPASIALFAVALAGGESAIAWLGFFASYAVFLDPTGRRRGLLATLPHLAIVAVWRAIYGAMGYGASGSALYIDPAREPVKFFFAMLERLPQLLGGGFGGPLAGMAGFFGRPAELAAIGVAVLALVLASIALYPVLRSVPAARFWALGAVLGTIPACATIPAGRLLLISGLGLGALVVHLCAWVVEPDRSPAPPRRAGWFAGALAVAYLVIWGAISPARLFVEIQGTAALGLPNRLAVESIDDTIGGRTLVVLAVPDPLFMCGQLPLGLASRDRPYPSRVRCIASVETQVRIRREDERTLVLEADDGLLNGFFVPLMRDASQPLSAGFTFDYDDVHLTVRETDAEHRPTRIALAFTDPLDDPQLELVVWSVEDQGYVTFVPPPVGESVDVHGQPMHTIFM